MVTVAETAVEDAHQLLLESVSVIDSGFTVFDQNDRLVLCNDNYLKIYETSRDLIVPGARFEDIIREGAKRGQYKQAIGDVEGWVSRRLAAHQNPSGIGIEQELDDGRWMLVVESKTPRGYIVGSRLDITASKQAEFKQKQLARALRLVTDCNTTLVHSSDEQRLLSDICRQIVESGGYMMAWIGFARADVEKSVLPVAQYGFDACKLDSSCISWSANQEVIQSPTSMAIRTGLRQIETNFRQRKDLPPWVRDLVENGCQSAVAFPLKINDLVIGNLTIYSAAIGAFEDDEIKLLTEMADNVAFGIQTLRARAELDRYREMLEQKVVERTAAIEKMAENTRLFIKQAPIAIAMFDQEMNYMEASGRWLDDYGLAHRDWCGRNHYAMHPDLPAVWTQVHQRALAGETLRDDEALWVHTDGTRQWLRWAVIPWNDGSGQIGGIIISAEDITARKLAEDQLRFAVADAERANMAKSRFLAAASHDLRQPLAALSIYAGSLKGHVTPKGETLLANLSDCVDSLSELLVDLLDLSKLDAGVVSPNLRDFSLSEVLDPLLAAHEPSAMLKGLQLRYLPSAMVVRSDPVLLRRIIGNLLSNAVRYTEQGGVLVACRRQNGKVWLEVWDTGIGIAAENAAEIFEEFKQLDQARTRGSGLGLAIVARTASLLGLAIRMQSRPGRGSLFAIELLPGLPLTEAPPAVTPVAAFRVLNVALVEDSKVVREAITFSLQYAGHRVTSAATGADLRELLRDMTPDILVADYRLPHDETGFNVIESLRAKTRNLPAILLTGDTDPRLVREMAEHGVAVLHKPVDLETLLAYLDELTGPARA